MPHRRLAPRQKVLSHAALWIALLLALGAHAVPAQHLDGVSFALLHRAKAV